MSTLAPCTRLADDHPTHPIQTSSSSFQAEKKAKKKQQKKKAAHSLVTVRLDDKVGRQVIKSPERVRSGTMPCPAFVPSPPLICIMLECPSLPLPSPPPHALVSVRTPPKTNIRPTPLLEPRTTCFDSHAVGWQCINALIHEFNDPKNRARLEEVSGRAISRTHKLSRPTPTPTPAHGSTSTATTNTKPVRHQPHPATPARSRRASTTTWPRQR